VITTCLSAPILADLGGVFQAVSGAEEHRG